MYNKTYILPLNINKGTIAKRLLLKDFFLFASIKRTICIV